MKSCIFGILLMTIAVSVFAAGIPGYDPAEAVRLGERIYRDGLLPDAKPLLGYVREDVEIDSTMFSCANCHTRSGLGSIEGQVASPPVNGASLYNPRYLYKDYIKNTISKSRGVSRSAKPTRPAYTDESLANALVAGVNPDGRELLPIMPRYMLEDRDMKILVNYLKNLSAEFSPGVTSENMRFATIITEDVSPEDRAALTGILDALVTINQQTREQRKHPQFSKMFRMLDTAYFRYITIDRWELKGSSETWRSQLEDYYRKGPVFAILGGISGKSWQPMHDFCEENKIPCLFPVTDLPVISDSSWYTQYASKGYYQEGETAARFISRIETEEPKRILQIMTATPEGEALASGFDSAWKESGQGQVETLRLRPGQKISESEVSELLRKSRPRTILVWGSPEALPVLETVAEQSPDSDCFLSGRYLGKGLKSIPENLRNRVYITYPFRMPEDEKRFVGYAELLQLGNHVKNNEKRIGSRTFSMVHVFLEGLKEMRLDFYRDTLLDVIGMMPDQYLPDFERYSFGPGQRYASKGCYVVQLGKGINPEIIRKSDWVVF